MYLSPARLKRAGLRAASAKWAFLLLEEHEGLLQDGGFRGEAAAADLLRDEALPVFRERHVYLREHRLEASGNSHRLGAASVF